MKWVGRGQRNERSTKQPRCAASPSTQLLFHSLWWLKRSESWMEELSCLLLSSSGAANKSTTTKQSQMKAFVLLVCWVCFFSLNLRVMSCRSSSAHQLHFNNSWIVFVSCWLLFELFMKREEEMNSICLFNKLNEGGMERRVDLSLLGSKPITNHPVIKEIENFFMKGAANQSINSHSIPQTKEIKFLFLFAPFIQLAWLKRANIKKYYNSTVIRAGIYLLSAIMKNFVLNYERQLVDSCDNNGRAEPIQINFINLRMERVSPQQLNQAKQTKQFNNQFNFIEWFLNAGCLFCGCCCPAGSSIINHWWLIGAACSSCNQWKRNLKNFDEIDEMNERCRGSRANSNSPFSFINEIKKVWFIEERKGVELINWKDRLF